MHVVHLWIQQTNNSLGIRMQVRQAGRVFALHWENAPRQQIRPSSSPVEAVCNAVCDTVISS